MKKSENEIASDRVTNSLRMDLSRSFQQSHLNPKNLSSFQRILLTTDGTVTDILEAQYWEAVGIVKLYQEMEETGTAVGNLDLPAGARVLIRKVLLKGKCTHKNYIYAESITVVDNLGHELKDGLISTGKPIGQLMIENRMESFREILSVKMEAAGQLCEYFGISAEDEVISRTYRIFCDRKPIMLITEVFPEASFKD